jgi:precorrin-2 dehydrogenase / sirohydrochlorin ferrochelatase
LSNLPSRFPEQKRGLFPISLKLAKRRCLIVGAGKTAEVKIPGLLSCGASLMVVAPVATPKIQAWAHNGDFFWAKKRFEPVDLDGIFLAVVATSAKSVNRMIFEEAQRRNVLCNVVRDRAHCDFYYPAVVRRGPLQIAISTDGHSGALAQRLREELEFQFGPEWELWLQWLGEARRSLYDDPLSPKRRRTMLHRLAGRKTQENFFRRWGALPKDSAKRS